MMFEVKVTKFATVRLEAEDKASAMLEVMDRDLEESKFASCWECGELGETQVGEGSETNH